MKSILHYPLAKLVLSSIVLGISYWWGLRPFMFRCLELFDLALTGYTLLLFEIVSAFMFFTLVYLVLDVNYQRDKKVKRSKEAMLSRSKMQNLLITIVVSIIQIIIVYLLVY